MADEIRLFFRLRKLAFLSYLELITLIIYNQNQQDLSKFIFQENSFSIMPTHFIRKENESRDYYDEPSQNCFSKKFLLVLSFFCVCVLEIDYYHDKLRTLVKLNLVNTVSPTLVFVQHLGTPSWQLSCQKGQCEWY